MTSLNFSRSQQLYVLVTVLVVLSLLAGIVFQKELYALYLMRFRGPELERQFGFTAGKVDVVTESGAQSGVFAVTSLVPTGILAKAGFRAGDIPVGYKHDLAAEFYQDLIRVQGGETVAISVTTAADLARGAQWRRLRIEPAREQ